MKKLLIFLSLTIFTTACKADDSYVLAHLYSTGFIVNGKSLTDVGGGRLDFEVINENMQATIYSKKECVNKIKDNIAESNEYDPLFEYKGNGVFSVNGAYSRYACLNESDLKDGMIDDKMFVTKSFMEAFADGVAADFVESEIKDYTIFPLDSDQKSARKLSKQLDKDLSKTDIKIK